MSTAITNFPITVYGKMERFSDTISKGRCRVFYKGLNRNGTFITDEFAEKLINSAPYTPVKGIYEVDDYTDHGKARNEGRIYGIVPAEPNFAWEKHVDGDGIEREYACFDVLYYTALYKEAGQIDGKSESMELYRDTLKGEWKIMNGKKVYVFTEGCFLGLQALGDEVEPCFEGASFYSLEDNIIALLNKYEKRTDLFQYHEQGGNETMPSINFKISDGQKYEMLSALLNPNFNEEGGWVLYYCVCEVYDEYAVVRNYQENYFERIYYTKNDETDSLEITNREKCYIIDVNEEEKTALETMKTSYESVNQESAEKDVTISSLQTENTSLLTEKAELEATVATLTEENSNYSTKVEELENNNSTLITERDEVRANYTDTLSKYEELTATFNALQGSYDAVVAEKDVLVAYKYEIEMNAKKAVVDSYVEHLSEEVIEVYMKNLDSYSIEELDMKLTYEQKKANPNLFTKTPVAPAQNIIIPKDDGCERGINDILARYEKH